MTNSIFTKIINKQIPCHLLYEDDMVIAFLDINPVRLGHTLIVPKIQVDYFVDVPTDYYQAVFGLAKKLAPAIEQALGTARIGLSVVGTEVPHFHLHLIPIVDGELVGKRIKVNAEILSNQAKLIKKRLNHIAI